MTFTEEFMEYVGKNYTDIAFSNRSDSLFPDIETGYILVRITYNKAYHSLDLRFNGMGEFEAIFGKYVYPVLMKYRGFSIWKMSSARVIRVKVPCVSEDVGFIEEDCDEQLEQARTLLEILSQIDVAAMYQEQREMRQNSFSSDSQVEAETKLFLDDYLQMLKDREREMEILNDTSYGKKGLLHRFSCMNKDIHAFVNVHSKFISENPNLECNQKLMEYMSLTEQKTKEIL